MIYIVEDFYPDPEKIREAALKLKYIDAPKLHPSGRALNPWAFNRSVLRNKFESITGKNIISTELKSHGSFNLGYSNKHYASRVHQDHHDGGNLWAAVIYLTPNPPSRSGTVFLRSPDGYTTGTKDLWRGVAYSGNIHEAALVDWTIHCEIENVYNRCIIYRGNMFHAPTVSAFGKSRETGRLTQVGFFFTED